MQPDVKDAMTNFKADAIFKPPNLVHTQLSEDDINFTSIAVHAASPHTHFGADSCDFDLPFDGDTALYIQLIRRDVCWAARDPCSQRCHVRVGELEFHSSHLTSSAPRLAATRSCPIRHGVITCGFLRPGVLCIESVCMLCFVIAC